MRIQKGSISFRMFSINCHNLIPLFSSKLQHIHTHPSCHLRNNQLITTALLRHLRRWSGWVGGKNANFAAIDDVCNLNP
ncbi:hypothetical protein HanRHA438_Chr05g0211201 [Helianthus annuus]|nr:hypothetical protein HanRHA438_Chr05g0211201 [Helianthus annuus]